MLQVVNSLDSSLGCVIGMNVMLAHLAIRDFAIIQKLVMDFEPGFIVITGETGAGKSILVNALHLVLGGRATEEMIRKGSQSAEVEGVFQLSSSSFVLASLDELGLCDHEWFRVRRIISRTGRNRVFVNDRSVSLSTLVRLASGLVDISGQHEHVGLTDESGHLHILDAFGGLGKIRSELADAVRAWREVSSKIKEAQTSERSRAEREDYLKFALERMDAVDPRCGEDEELERERSRLANVERLREGLLEALGMVYEMDSSAVELVGKASKLLAVLASVDQSMSAFAEQLEQGTRIIEDCARDMGRYAESLESDPARLEQVLERIGALRGLIRAHGPDLDAVLARRAEFADELQKLEVLDVSMEDLQQSLSQKLSAAMDIADGLSDKRKVVARQLAQNLSEELRSLAMPHARFEVEVKTGGDENLDETGVDAVRFLFSANSGEPVLPLASVASGGELSRVLLAMKSVLSKVDPVSVYVFDEVDSGVGGATAEVIGQKLSSVAQQHQVMCITHLPQIASFGSHHYVVRKETVSGRTRSVLVKLATQKEKIEEIARMMAGGRMGKKARLLAEDMLSSRAAGT